MKTRTIIYIVTVAFLTVLCIPAASAGEATKSAEQVKKFDIAGLLGGLQKKVTLGNAHAQPTANKNVTGLKQVDLPQSPTVDGEYTVSTTGDILLDNGSLGEATPSDVNPDVR